MITDACPQCGRKTLSENRDSPFCEWCVREKGSSQDETAHVVHVESKRIAPGASLLRCLWFVVFTNTLMSIIIGGVFTLLMIGLALASLFGGIAMGNGEALRFDAAHVMHLPLGIAMMCGFSWCFVSLASIPMSIWYFVADFFGRHVRLEQKQVHVRYGLSRWTLDLADCRYMSSRFGWDLLGAYAPTHQYVTIQASDGKRSVTCGFSEAAADEWRQRLEEAGVKEYERPPKSLLINLIVGGLGGLAAGCLLGWIVFCITGNSAWVASASILGAIDGTVANFVLKRAKLGKQHRAWLEKNYSPLSSTLMFALLGMKVGVIAGFAGLVALGIANGVVGLALAWIFSSSDDSPKSGATVDPLGYRSTPT